MTDDVEKRFERAMFELGPELGKGFGRYLEMLRRDGDAVKTAERLINSEPTSGFIWLVEHGKLDWSVEALVVNNPEYHQLFEDKVINRARRRLSDCGYFDVPPSKYGQATADAINRAVSAKKAC